MARQTFFSFHYDDDVGRANVVKNSWVTQDRSAAGFFDSSAFETAKKTGTDALKRFLDRELTGSSVLCVLIGAVTAQRPWVQYEIVRAVATGKGVLGVRIHNIKNFSKQTSSAGPNPFDRLGFAIDDNGRVAWQIFDQLNSNWKPFSKLDASLERDLRLGSNVPRTAKLSKFFPVYDYVSNDGYMNLGAWIEAAAKAAGR